MQFICGAIFRNQIATYFKDLFRRFMNTRFHFRQKKTTCVFYSFMIRLSSFGVNVMQYRERGGHMVLPTDCFKKYVSESTRSVRNVL